MKFLITLAVAAAFLTSNAAFAQVMQQGTKDRVSAYVRVSIAWITNNACTFVIGDEREAFLDQVAGNVIGLRQELSDGGTNPQTAKAFLEMLQGQAIKHVQVNHQECDMDAEVAVHEGILEAAAINESIEAHGPYIDPREETEN